MDLEVSQPNKAPQDHPHQITAVGEWSYQKVAHNQTASHDAAFSSEQDASKFACGYQGPNAIFGPQYVPSVPCEPINYGQGDLYW
jgi:hypothetical protein